MKKTLLSIFAFSAVMASAQIADFPVTISTNTINSGETVSVTIDSSQLGYDYYLRDNSNNNIVLGPVSGNEGSIAFNTGSLTSNTTFNVFAKDQDNLLEITSYNDYIDFTNDNRGIDQEVTVAAWIKTNQSSGLRNIVLDYGAGDAGYILRIDDNGRASISGRDGTNTYKTSNPSTTVVTDNQWHYIVGSIDLNNGGQWKIFVDGVFENGGFNGAGNSMANNDNLYIGHTFSTSASYLGKIRDVTIWNKALTDAQIVSNMSACISGTESDIVGHFLLNENDIKVIDYSTTAINGVYTNGTPSNSVENTSCNDSLEMSQTVTVIVNSVGIDELSSESLSIYPNPATSQITITNNQSQVLNIKIIDVTGKTVTTVNGNVNTVNVSDLARGIYFLQVQTENGLLNSKFIKE